MRKIVTSLFLCVLLSMSAQNQAPEATATDGTLTVTFSTNATSEYSLAVFVTNSSGGLVNTMIYRTSNGKNSAQDMSTFWSKIGSSWGTAASKLLTNADLDATSGATASSAYTAKSLYWGKTVSLSSVVDGTYTVNFEMANYSGTVSRRYTSGTFVKGSANSSSTVSTIVGFSNMTISWVPKSTGLNEIKLSNLYSVYPNPTKSDIYVNGPDVRSVTIYNLAGKQLLKAIVPNLNLSKLPAGTYLAEIETGRGTVTKKIVKK